MIIHSQLLPLLSPQPQPPLPMPIPFPPLPQPPQKNKRRMIQIQLPHPPLLLLFVLHPQPQPLAVKSLIYKPPSFLFLCFILCRYTCQCFLEIYFYSFCRVAKLLQKNKHRYREKACINFKILYNRVICRNLCWSNLVHE